MAIFGNFLRPVFAASRVQHISDLHSKFALGPRQSNLWPLRLGEEKKKKNKKIDRKKLQGKKYYGPLLHRAAIKSKQQNQHIIVSQKYTKSKSESNENVN